MKNEIKKKDASLPLDKNYRDFLTGIKERLKSAQIRAALAANSELINFYWDLGMDLLEKQKSFRWGGHFLEQFSHDMRKAFPEMQGFSVTTLKRMRLFAQEYPNFKIGAQPVHQLPWGHIVVLIHRVNKKERDWYAKQIIKNGWSRSILEMQIESDLYRRQAKSSEKISNYHKHLPASQSNLATEILKDPYNFDFLTIQGPAHERAVEDGLVAHIRDFLLELGQGFAFIGSQVPLTFEEQEFFVDLLFYHLHLRCFVVIELLCDAAHNRSYVVKLLMCCIPLYPAKIRHFSYF
jgi:predicted nuclease of restriction endonuclease-like (RecB) superfamily